jgi:3-phosphoshikimate 1-carboxyvinyltransferase
MTAAQMTARRAGPLKGVVRAPGDKSISHRALILGALAHGVTEVEGLLEGEDVRRTAAAMAAFGAGVERLGEGRWRVEGKGAFAEPTDVIDCGNAGTGVRLIMGAAAGFDLSTTFTGDASLRGRPMNRVLKPLGEMGATWICRAGGRLPLTLKGGSLRHLAYRLPEPSAQVKSAVLLAGLNADGPTTVVEPRPSRDHTELMLEAAGAAIRRRPSSVTVEPAGALRLGEVLVPGDFSSAAPFIVAAALLPGSELTIHDVNLNPRRIGLLTVLERMGAHISIFNRRRAGAEPVADLEIRSAPLTAFDVSADEVPAMVDELPLLALAAAHAHGTTVVSGAEELRVKESDRVEAVADALRAVGARVKARPDGWEITGVPSRLRGGRVDAVGDHRIAMLGAVAGLVSRAPVEIQGAEVVAVSFPGFFDLLESVTRR